RPDLSKNCFGEWETPDGFAILLLKGMKPVIRRAKTRETVRLDELSDELRTRLEDDYEEAVWREPRGDMEIEPKPHPNALPEIDNAEDLLADDDITVPDEVVRGVLHKSCKAILGGASKARKTWILLDLAVSVAAGVPFWKWETVAGNVLVIN